MLVPQPVPFAAGPASTGRSWLPGQRAGLCVRPAPRARAGGARRPRASAEVKDLDSVCKSPPRPIGPLDWPQRMRAFVYTPGGGGRGRGLRGSTLSPTVT